MPSNFEALFVESYGAAISGDGQSAVTFRASDNGAAVIVWHVKTGKQRVIIDKRLGLSGDKVYPVLSHDGKKMITSNEQGTVLSWLLDKDHIDDPHNNTWKGHQKKAITSPTNSPHVLEEEDTGKIWFAAFSPDDNYVLSVAGDLTVRVTDFDWGKEVFAFRNPTFQNANIAGLDDVVGIGYAAFSPNSKMLVTASADGGARLYDLSKRTVPADMRSLLALAWAKLSVTLTRSELKLLLEEKRWWPRSYTEPRTEDVDKLISEALTRKGSEECCRVTPESAGVLDALKAVLDEELGIDSSVYKCESRLALEYGIEDSDFAKLSKRLAKKFTVTTSDYEPQDMLTICDIYQLLKRKGATVRRND